jgi:hypothetical protein
MAEYYPLLAKAVSGLPVQTPEARRTVYDRARKALLGQLNAMQPPVPKVDIDREAHALDAAIEKLETELDPLSKAIAEAVAAVSTPVAAEMMSSDAVSHDAAARDDVAGKTDTVAKNDAAAKSEAAARNDTAPGPDFGRYKREQRPPFEAPKPGKAEAPARDPPARFESPVKLQPAVDVGPLPNAEFPTEAADLDEWSSPTAGKSRPVALPPIAGEEGGQWRLWLVGSVVGLVVAGVAIAAFLWRDRPEELNKLHPMTTAPANVESSGKLSGRVGQPGQQNTPVTQIQVPTVPIKPTTAPSEDAAPKTGAIPVAQRAALLVEAPDEQDKTKTYVGTVVWRLESLSKGEGQPLATVVKADIDIPDAKLKASMVLQKNLDTTLPASHTIELRFLPGAGSDIGPIQEINTPQIRAEGMPTGEPLSGVPVQIAPNWFLVGLSQTDSDRNHNADLIKKNSWFDVQMILANKKLAKITFEKGQPGEKVITDAFATWQ